MALAMAAARVLPDFNQPPNDGSFAKYPTGSIKVPTLYMCGKNDPAILCNHPFALKTENQDNTSFASSLPSSTMPSSKKKNKVKAKKNAVVVAEKNKEKDDEAFLEEAIKLAAAEENELKAAAPASNNAAPAAASFAGKKEKDTFAL